jgi:hypothetical protein
MKVKELIAELQTMDPEAELIVQKDAEGNGYSPLAGADHEAIYIAETTWYGEVYSTEYSAEDMDMDEDEWQEILAKPRCVVLYPVN